MRECRLVEFVFMKNNISYTCRIIRAAQHCNNGYGILILLFSLFSLFSDNTYAQGKAQHAHIGSNIMIEAKAGYGFLIPHKLEMEIFNAHFPSFEIGISKKTFGSSRWEFMYGYPVVGVALWYSNLGSSPYLGDAYALFPYINFPITPNKPTRLYFRTGIGLGYLTKHFDRLDNYKNIAIGSTLNAAVSLSLELRIRIMSRLHFNASMSLTHFSNGSMKTPNYGINIPSIYAGVAYKLSKENKYQKRKLLPKLYPYEFDGKKFFNIQLGGGIGYKNMNAEVGGSYMVYAGYVNVMKQVSFKSRLGIGFDVSYDGTDQKIVETENGVEDESSLPYIKTGGNVGWELMISKVSFMLNVGGYFSGKYQKEGGIYEKLSFLYYFNDHIYSSITLKAHYARADYITIGIGYNFNIKYY